MFDQDLFDNLTKGLATNRLSRGQVIKSFAAGLLLAGLLRPGFARVAEAQMPEWRKDPVRVGSCNELGMYVNKTGVTDESGENYPGAAGVTTYHCRFPARPLPKYKKVKCKKGKKGRVCIRTTTQVGGTFTALGKVTTIDWQPTEQQTAKCSREWNKFNAALKAHEQRHVDSINKAVAAANSRWSTHEPFTASGANEQQAVNNLRLEIQKAEAAECANINKEINEQGAIIDKDQGMMDCRECSRPATGCAGAGTDCNNLPPGCTC